MHWSWQLDTGDHRKDGICKLLFFHWWLYGFLHPTAQLEVFWATLYWHGSFFSLQTSPFGLCTSTSANRNRSKYRTKNQMSTQYCPIHVYIFCSKWVELTKIVWTKQFISKALTVWRSEHSGKCKTKSPKNRGITDSSPVFQMRALWVSQKGKNKSTISHSNPPALKWGNRVYKPVFSALSTFWS